MSTAAAVPLAFLVVLILMIGAGISYVELERSRRGK
tara:strand:+ start:689 stop:796 length:108 start_codon:yes stop_codon:yes gene_type:complete